MGQRLCARAAPDKDDAPAWLLAADSTEERLVGNSTLSVSFSRTVNTTIEYCSALADIRQGLDHETAALSTLEELQCDTARMQEVTGLSTSQSCKLTDATLHVHGICQDICSTVNLQSFATAKSTGLLTSQTCTDASDQTLHIQEIYQDICSTVNLQSLATAKSRSEILTDRVLFLKHDFQSFVAALTIQYTASSEESPLHSSTTTGGSALSESEHPAANSEPLPRPPPRPPPGVMSSPTDSVVLLMLLLTRAVHRAAGTLCAILMYLSSTIRGLVLQILFFVVRPVAVCCLFLALCRFAYLLLFTLTVCTLTAAIIVLHCSTVKSRLSLKPHTRPSVTPHKRRRLHIVCAIVVSMFPALTASPLISIRDAGDAVGGRAITVTLEGSPNTGYSATITIGRNNPQQFGVLVDTGSSNLAIAGKKNADITTYFLANESSSYISTGRRVSVTYTEGGWSGELGREEVGVGGGEPVEVSLVVISEAERFYIAGAPWQGILGMAYSSLAKPDDYYVGTFWDSLRAAKQLPDVFTIQLCPPLDKPALDITEPQGGSMVLGGINESLYRGEIFYTRIVEEKFYNVLLSNISVGSMAIELECSEFNNDKTIVDSGTTDIFFNTAVFDKVTESFTAAFEGGVPLAVPLGFWSGDTKLAWPVDDLERMFAVFPTLHLSFAVDNDSSQAFTLGVTPQIYLRREVGTTEEQVATNCFPECDFFTFGIKKRERGTVIGGNVMLGFTTVFDRERRRIGFAETNCTQQEPSGVPYITGPFPRDPIDCSCTNCAPGLFYWDVVTYSTASFVGFLGIFFFSYSFCCWLRRRGQRSQRCHVGCSVLRYRVRRCCCCRHPDNTAQESSEEVTSLISIGVEPVPGGLRSVGGEEEEEAEESWVGRRCSDGASVGERDGTRLVAKETDGGVASVSLEGHRSDDRVSVWEMESAAEKVTSSIDSGVCMQVPVTETEGSGYSSEDSGA